MDNPDDSAKRLEMHVKRISKVAVAEESTPRPRANMASPDTEYVGSMVGKEEGYPAGMRRRVLEAPLGSKIGYHELEDEKEEADEEWMTGDASQLSGAGTRGSSNWVLKVMLPITLIVGVIVMHTWWSDVKEQASAAIDAVGDVFDRRALSLQAGEDAQQAGGAEGGVAEKESASGAEARREQAQGRANLPDKAVYSLRLDDAGANAENDRAKA